MSNVEQLQIELKELRKYVNEKIAELNEKYFDVHDSIQVDVMPRTHSCIFFNVNLDNLKNDN